MSERQIQVVSSHWDSADKVIFFEHGHSRVIYQVNGEMQTVAIPMREQPYTEGEKDLLRKGTGLPLGMDARSFSRMSFHELVQYTPKGDLYGVYVVFHA